MPKINDFLKVFKDSANENEFVKNYRRSPFDDGASDEEIHKYYKELNSLSKDPKRDPGNPKSFSSGYLGRMFEAQTIHRSGAEKINIESLFSFFDQKRGRYGENMGVGEKIFGSVMDQTILQLEQEFSLHRKINEQTSLTGELSEIWRQEIMDTVPHAQKIGYSFFDVQNAMSTLIKSSGRFKLLSQETMESLMTQSKAFFDGLDQGVESLEQFQKVSMGASDAMEVVEEIGIRTLSLGLNAKETVNVLTKNLEKMNQYGFKNGIDGLAKMTRQAQALRFDMSKTFDLATKVMDPDNALSLASNLQVIGGALGDFNDPIKMMWMATNNVEGLQDALVKSVESLATFDSKSKTFKVIGADLRRAKAMADELGMSMGDLTNLAVQSAQRTSAAYDIGLSTISNVDENDIEFLTNLAQMKDGKMTITIPESISKKFGDMTEIALTDLNNVNSELILENRKSFEKLSSEDLISKQVGLVENINRNLSFIAASMRVKSGGAIKGYLNDLGVDQSDISDIIHEITKEGVNTIIGYGEKADDIIRRGGKHLSSALDRTTVVSPQSINVTPTQSNPPTQHSTQHSTQSEPVVVNVYHKVPANEGEKFWRAIQNYSEIQKLFVDQSGTYTDAN